MDRNAKRIAGPPVLETGDDWDKFRRRFEAYGERAGLRPALRRAEQIMSKRDMKVRSCSTTKDESDQKTDEGKG